MEQKFSLKTNNLNDTFKKVFDGKHWLIKKEPLLVTYIWRCIRILANFISKNLSVKKKSSNDC